MRFSIAVAFAASLASAYTVLKRQTDLPQCAQTCYTEANPSPCNTTDVACLCLNANFLKELASCTQKDCNPQEVEAAQAWGQATCQAAGINFQQPVPACAQACDKNSTPSSTCAAGDTACFCKDSAYVNSLVQCVRGTCTGQDLTTAEIVGAAVCRAVDVDISSIMNPA
ncbi:hypothetical protein M407DRAFT_26481 [Tulasnella calospora MUT 4182]|uniref:CFEM domain-containing protein n=1 Tax=Tulasnella calospora MUT 4182 TaxID=1051891 RepID=A0A0C3Q4Y2_9AGAM|nr:hypothetical protein M407DRAFT_26481 [Tulasnella calospora MUT 4182]